MHQILHVDYMKDSHNDGFRFTGHDGEAVVRFDGRESKYTVCKNIPDGAEITDISGQLIFPGFIDAHTHLTFMLPGLLRVMIFRQGEWRLCRAEQLRLSISRLSTKWNENISRECQYMID